VKIRAAQIMLCMVFLFSFASAQQPVLPTAPPVAEPLRALLQAKTVYLISGHVKYPKTKAFIKVEWVDSTPFEEPLQKEIEKWGRFTSVPDAKNADLVIRAYMTGSTQSMQTITPGVTGSVTVGSTFIVLDVVQPSTRKILWSASKNSGRSWSTNTAVSGLVKDFRKFLEQQEATAPAKN
jgi:hypothetical protein